MSEIKKTAILKFKEARTAFIDFLEAHSNCTREDLITGLDWLPKKVDIFLDLCTRMGVAIPVQSASGELVYQYEDFRKVLKRKSKERLGTSTPQGVKEGSKDWIQLLEENNLL
jgi:hypothetical protein